MEVLLREVSNRPTISIIIPTKGRETLRDTISSLREAGLGINDEVIVVGDGETPLARSVMSGIQDARFHYFEYGPTGNYGNSQRDFAIFRASKDFLVFLDDDDAISKDGFKELRRCLAQGPGQPHCFRWQAGPNSTLGPPVPDHWLGSWTVGGAMFVPPNKPGKLGVWCGPYGNAGGQDAFFILNTIQHYLNCGVMGHDCAFYHIRPKYGSLEQLYDHGGADAQ